MICETSPYPAGTDNIVQTASGSALVNLVDAEGTPIGSVKQGVSLPRDSFAGSALNFPVRMCPPNGTFVRISQPFSGNVIKGPISAAVTAAGNSSVFRHADPRTRLPLGLSGQPVMIFEIAAAVRVIIPSSTCARHPVPVSARASPN